MEEIAKTVEKVDKFLNLDKIPRKYHRVAMESQILTKPSNRWNSKNTGKTYELLRFMLGKRKVRYEVEWEIGNRYGYIGGIPVELIVETVKGYLIRYIVASEVTK